MLTKQTITYLKNSLPTKCGIELYISFFYQLRSQVHY